MGYSSDWDAIRREDKVTDKLPFFLAIAIFTIAYYIFCVVQPVFGRFYKAKWSA